MAIDTDFAQILERLEGKIEAQGTRLEEKIDAQSEKLQSIDTRLARIEEKTDGLGDRLDKLEGSIQRQDNRIWAYLTTTTVTLLGGLLAILSKFLLFPNQ
ncbi:MAG: hypothetical protein RI580_10395 [Halothece sp. Uz-M2-17]|nr:hypothetical protein [Halothece sp. Uz-M2-17]